MGQTISDQGNKRAERALVDGSEAVVRMRRSVLVRLGTLLWLSAALLFMYHETRPRTDVRLQFGPTAVQGNVAASSFSAPLENFQFSNISIRRHRSMVSESALERLTIDGQEVFEPAAAPFFSGRLLGLSRVDTEVPFRFNLGDWSHDGFSGRTELIASASHAAPVVVQARLTGRGSVELAFQSVAGNSADSAALVLNVRSGLMDNDVSLCWRGGGCLYSGGLVRRWQASIRNLANSALWWLLLASMMGILVTLIEVCAVLCGVLRVHQSSPLKSARWERASWWAVGTAALVHFGLSAWFSHILGGAPHIPDEVVYLQQARTLAHGSLTVQLPAGLSQRPFRTLGAVEQPGALAFYYNRAWPLLLSGAVRLGIEPYLNPMLSALTVVVMFSWLRHLVGVGAAVFAALTYAVSPFAITQAGSYMTHISTCFLFLAGLEAARRGVCHGRLALLFLAGLLVACAGAIRPLTVVGLALPALVWFLVLAVRHQKFWRASVLGVLGVVPVAVGLLLDNLSITGSALQFPHMKYHGSKYGLAVFAEAAMLMDSTLALLSPILLATPLMGMSCALVMLPLVLRPKFQTVFLLAFGVTLVAVYHTWPHTGLHGYGPRFLFEATPYLCGLVGLGMAVVWERLSLPMLRFGVLLCGIAMLGWNSVQLSKILPTYSEYNGISPRITRWFFERSQEPTIVVIERGAQWFAQGYVNMWLDPTLQRYISLYAPTAAELSAVRARYPNHTVYEIFGGVVHLIGPDGKRQRIEPPMVVG